MRLGRPRPDRSSGITSKGVVEGWSAGGQQGQPHSSCSFCRLALHLRLKPSGTFWRVWPDRRLERCLRSAHDGRQLPLHLFQGHEWWCDARARFRCERTDLERDRKRGTALAIDPQDPCPQHLNNLILETVLTKQIHSGTGEMRIRFIEASDNSGQVFIKSGLVAGGAQARVGKPTFWQHKCRPTMT